MGLLDRLIHLLNFFAPALAVALLLPLAARIFIKKTAEAPVLPAQIAINLVAGALVLSVGLWYFGHDGKMATYAAMLLAMASTQWWFTRR